MEKFFLRRWAFALETWQIGLVLIVAALGVIGFGALVEHAAGDKERAPAISKVAFGIARIPANSRKVFKSVLTKQHRVLAVEQRFEGEAGFQRFKAGPDEAMLLARYDGDKERSVVEIVDLEDGRILHEYAPDIGAINARSKKTPQLKNLSRDAGPNSYRIGHPYLTDDGGLIFHSFFTPLIKIDVCSNIVWTIDKPFHHSIEKDADGNFWTASGLFPATMEYSTSDEADGTIIHISPEGTILFEKSVVEILIENNLKHLVYVSQNPADLIHLNDIQPVLADGPFWRKGDIFLSLRFPDAIVLYRPTTDKVIWYRVGPWMLQHDVDIISDHEVAVFNNNAAFLSWGQRVLGHNDTIIYDFETDEISIPYAEGFKANDIRTITEGLSEILPDGEIFVEEQNYGRMLKMNTAGELTWQFVNRAMNGRVYIVNWSRYIDKTRAQRAAAIAAEKCNG